ncbi:hypothetical protein PINS_up008949 [Pythium insidiosum]|nr:hypothetical protein PINS_up008949 [Pythium insidiosum]
MMHMMQEYARLEAQHAERLASLAKRMEACVERVTRCAAADDAQQSEPSLCVDTMDQVVTFLVRFSSMHRQLSACVESDVLEDWARFVTTHRERIDTPSAEFKSSQLELIQARRDYDLSSDTFTAKFNAACEIVAKAMQSGIPAVDIESLFAGRGNIDATACYASMGPTQTKPTGLAASLSRLMPTRRPDNEQAIKRLVADAEIARQQCREIYLKFHRQQVKFSRFCNTMFHEYKSINEECIWKTRSSIRKLIVHISAFTSNLQYDATQLFHGVESMKEGSSCDSEFFPTSLPDESLLLSFQHERRPPSEEPITLHHVLQRRFPVASGRPQLLRHQNAQHALIA